MELELCIIDKAANRYASNYNAWNYRRHLLNIIIQFFPDSLAREDSLTFHFAFSHLSDCSAWCYRRHFLECTQRDSTKDAERIEQLKKLGSGNTLMQDHLNWCRLRGDSGMQVVS